jgi:hypothetical protein
MNLLLAKERKKKGGEKKTSQLWLQMSFNIVPFLPEYIMVKFKSLWLCNKHNRIDLCNQCEAISIRTTDCLDVIHMLQRIIFITYGNLRKALVVI